MKNPLLWGALFVFSVACVGIGSLVQGGESGPKASNGQLDTCHLEGSQTGTVIGVVTAVRPADGTNQMISTVMSSQGCEVSVSGHPMQMGLLGIVNSPVRFQATSSGGFLSNPQEVKKDSSALAANQLGYQPQKGIRSSMDIYYGEEPNWISKDEGTISIMVENQNMMKFLITRTMANQLKVGEWYTLYYDDQYNIVGVEKQ